MRLRRLALARYGKFTDRVLDFGEAVPGGPDLHVVHGPNEAGKSTLFSAYLDLLFGIEPQTRYGFLHPYDTMRVGGCLELSTGPRELVRIKKPNPTLRDADHQPLPQGLLAGELGGLDRAAYRTMFSLDDETLESGGESILASNGELGQLLFSASAGLAELSRRLLDVRAAADGFTWPNARSGELHRLKAELARSKEERDRIDTQAGAFAQLARARDEAEAAYRTCAAEVVATKRSLAQIRSLRTALPRLADWDAAQAKLRALGDLPDVPVGWQEELPALERAEAGHRSATEAATAEVARLHQVVKAIGTDDAALAWSGRLGPLDTHLARHTTAALDLPPRRAELEGADAAVQGILVRLGRADEPDPGTLLLTAAQAAGFDTLLAERSGIEATLSGANDELAEAVGDLSAARAALGPDPAPTGASIARLGTALAAWRASDHPARLGTVTRLRSRLEEALATQLAGLRPWSGEAAALGLLVIPDTGALQALQQAASEAAALLQRWRGEVERAEAGLSRHRTELASVGVSGGVSGGVAGSPGEEAAVRTAREAAWARHRRNLDAASADAFEAALRQDDLMVAARLRHERDRARIEEAERAAEVAGMELAAARRGLAEAIEAERRRSEQEAAVMAGVGLAALPLAALPGWIGRRAEAVETWQRWQEAEREWGEMRAEAEMLRAGLRDALSSAGAHLDPAADGDALAAAAQDRLHAEERLALLRAAVAECEKSLRKRERAVGKAADADQAWWEAWRQACAGCWLGAATAVPSVKATVAAAADLGPALDRRAGLARRIRDMEQDQAAFAAEVDRLAAELGLVAGGRAKPDLAVAITERVQAAVRADSALQEARKSLAAAEAVARRADAAAAAHASRCREMMAVLQAGSLLEVAGRLRDIADKAALERTARAAEGEIGSVLAVETLADARALLHGRTLAALADEEAALAGPLEEMEQRSRTLFAARQAAVDRIEAIGGDDAAARVEERRQTQLLEIEDKAQHYLRLRLGIAAADRALRAYRDEHRSSMMRQASDAFATISGGAYRGLGTQPGKDGDILVALGRDGGSKLAADLSKGTRFQLYLALRAAGYREFTRVRPAVPFIADDIMETFDDGRAEETIRVLGEMSGLGQVIYLTHHGHLREIAARAVPGVRVHELLS